MRAAGPDITAGLLLIAEQEICHCHAGERRGILVRCPKRNKGRHGYGSGTARIASGVWLVHSLHRRTCGLIVDGQWTSVPLRLSGWRSAVIHNDSDEATSKTWDRLPAKELRERWACQAVGMDSYLGWTSVINGPSSWDFLTETFVRAMPY